MDLLKFAQANGANQLAHARLMEYPIDQLMTAASSQNFARNEQFNPLLAERMWAYRNPDNAFIAEQVCKVIPVTSLTGQWRNLSANTMFDVPKVNTGKETPPNKVEFGSALTAWSLSGRALSIFMSNVDKAQAVSQYGSVARWRQINARVLMNLMMLAYESEVATLLQADANYASGYYATESPLWNASNSTPRKDVDGYVDTPILSAPDLLILSYDVFRALKTNNDIVGAVTVSSEKRRTALPMVDEMVLENAFGYPVIVGKALYNSAPDTPSTPTYSRLWANYAIVGTFMSEFGGPEFSPTFVKTFQLQDGAANMGSVNGFTYRSIPTEIEGGVGGELLVIVHWIQPKMISSKSAYKAKVL